MATSEVKVPDVGTDKPVDVIEISVKVGDTIAKEQTLIVLESDKATVEVPSPDAGVVQSIAVKVGDQLTQGALILSLDVEGAAAPTAPAGVAAGEAAGADAGAAKAATDSGAKGKSGKDKAPAGALERGEHAVVSGAGEIAALAAPKIAALAAPAIPARASADVHAGPAVRKLARELGVNLGEVAGTGTKGRVTKDDVSAQVKKILTAPARVAAPSGGSALPELPRIDFTRWGAVEDLPLSKLRRVAAQNLHRAWLHIPHVTHNEEADISELEAFRVSENERLKDAGVKLTMLAFLVKACVAALKQYPRFNSSLGPEGERLILKHYWHIGIAVDTPDGLVVPVIRDADRKGVVEIAREMGEISRRARDKKLTPADMQGATFSISSLGGIGGTGFTPIVNWPEVAILGVSKSQLKPVWNGKKFEPRLHLPLSLSYDHRVIDGADAARFCVALAAGLSDSRRLIL